MRTSISLFLAVSCLFGATVAAGAPSVIAYFGHLAYGGSGAPYEGDVSLSVSLWTTESGGAAALFSESSGTISVADGRLSTLIGQTDPAALESAVLAASGSLWLELTVDGTIMVPRQEVVAVPFALRARVADTLEGHPAADFVGLAGDGTIDVAGVTVGGMPVIDSDGSWVGDPTGLTGPQGPEGPPGPPGPPGTSGSGGSGGGSLGTPDYDSGWLNNPGNNSTTSLTHNLGTKDFAHVLVLSSCGGNESTPLFSGAVTSSGTGQYGQSVRFVSDNSAEIYVFPNGGAYTVSCGGSTKYRLQLWRKDSGSSDASVPSGAVMPFNLSSCPTGWSPIPGLAGRTVIGAGSLNGDVYGVGDTGGAARVSLSVDEMPSHSHKHPYQVESNIAGGSLTRATLTGSSTNGINTTSAGGNQPHENRPPYLALLYCQKD